MTLETEGIAGIVDDTSEPAKTSPPADQTQLINGLQSQIQTMQSKIQETASLKAEKDEVIDRFSKAVGFIEGSGTGKYDKETGTITKIEKVQQGPSPMEELQEKITSNEKNIMQQYKDGDITQVEYYEQLQESVAPLKDRYRDMQFDQKLNKMKEDLTPNKKDESIVAPTSPRDNISQAYSRFADEYPDISNKDSQLFQKMDEIYAKNKTLYKDANFNDGKGNPDQYRDLIERATIELKVAGIDVKKQQAAIRSKFATPGNKGYQEPPAPQNTLNKEQIGMMVSQGITKKSLLNEINSAVGSWSDTGQMVMDD